MIVAMYKDGRYQKASIVNGHLEEGRRVERNFSEITTFMLKIDYGIFLTEEKLKNLNIPNLGYIKTEYGFIVYDVTKEEYTEEILPVVVDVMGEIKDTKKFIPYKQPTEESLEASMAIRARVVDALIQISNKEKIEKIQKLITENKGIAYVNNFEFRIPNISSFLCDNNIKILFDWQGNHFIVGSIAKEPVLDLYVPEKIIPMVIGRGGTQIKKIASRIMAERINVKPIRS